MPLTNAARNSIATFGSGAANHVRYGQITIRNLTTSGIG